MKTISFKDGKFFGYETPDEPKKEKYGYVAPSLEEQGGRTIEGGEDAYDQAFMEWQTSTSSNALEVENHGLLPGVTCHGEWRHYSRVLHSGDTFPLPETLEWETICKWSPGMISNFCSRCMGKCPDKVLRLKEKAVVKSISLDGHDQKKNYEEAAKEYVKWHNLKAPMETDGESTFRIWLAGAAHADKTAYNRAIDAALRIVRYNPANAYELLQKLKI